MIVASDKKNNLIMRFEENSFSNQELYIEARKELLEELKSNTPNSATFDLLAVRQINKNFFQLSYEAIQLTKFHSLKIINSTQEIKDFLKELKLDKIVTIIS